MQMPGRKYSPTNGYRYGFNGKEKDNKDGVVQYDYGFRIYNPALGRFLSVDPLCKEYPWNSPYAFAENRPIDGIDLDGLEFATVVYHYYFGAKTPVFTLEWHNNNQHNVHGKLGEGVAWRSQHYDAKGNIVEISKTQMFKRNSLGDHGFYCGPTQLDGKNGADEVFVVKNYMIEAIDAIDEAGRIHDKAYDDVGATADNATKSWATIEADGSLIERAREVNKIYNGINKGITPIDPFNKQLITRDEAISASNVINYFLSSRWNKIEAVSYFMEEYYSAESKKGNGKYKWSMDNEDNQRSNYELFRSKYMHKDNNGTWLKNDGMWKTVGEGKTAYEAPMTPEELKK